MAQKKRSSARKKPAAKSRAASKRKKKDTKDYLPAHICISALISIFLGIFMYFSDGGIGIVSTSVKNGLISIAGTTAYIIPPALAALTVYLICEKDTGKFYKKCILSALAVICLSAIIELITSGDLSSFAVSAGNGGIIGAFVAVMLIKLVQKIASYIILISALLILIGAVVGISTIKTTAELISDLFVKAKKAFFDFKDNYEYVYSDDDDYDEYTEPKRKSKKLTDAEKREIFNAANARDFDEKSDTEEKIKEKKPLEEDNEEPEDSFIDDGIDRVFMDLDTKFEDEQKNKVIVSDTKPAKVKSGENTAVTESDTESEEGKSKDREKKMTSAEKADFNSEFNEAIEKEIPPYVFPPMNLLKKPPEMIRDQRAELRNTATKLISILGDFGVRATLLQVTQGPAVTRYEIQPDTGVKLSKISSLADDIALNLAVNTVLVAPVPGKAAVGIEIPNNKVSSVSIREIIETDDFKNAKSKLTFALGKDIGGSVVMGDIAKMPHLLIAGATGSGKSVCINTIIMSLLYKADPKDVKLIMVDPKVVELGVYNGIPHLMVPVVTDPKKAAGALNWAVSEMMRRYELFKETGVRKLESYNKLMESTGGEKVPQLVIIIDELADLMMVAAKEVEDYICRIAQLARAAGIHLIIATQRPSVDVITGLIKANIPSRIAFAVSSQVDSRTILDKGGAEKLLGMGDMLYHPAGSRDARRVQGAFVSDDEIEKIISFIKENCGDNHYSEDLAEQIERCATGENGVTPDTEDDGDALLPDAIALAMDMGKISTSMVQRRLGVGYSRAGRIIDQMEARGIISGANGSKPREVLKSYADIPKASVEDEI